MRRGSLVGPLLLIVVGVWFLVSSLRPDLPLLDVAARYWPFVLIGWGVLRLLELLVWAARGRPLPYSGISGGEWVGIVFISLIGSGLYAVHHARPWQHLGVIHTNRIEIFGQSYDFQVPEQKAPADKAARVLVENLYGGTRITGAEGREVVAGGRKTIRALAADAAESANEQTPLEISVQGDQVVIRTNQDRLTGEQRITTDLNITVPRGVSVEVRGRRGDIEIGSIAGPVDISSDNAGVRLENIGSRARLDLRRSDLVRAFKVNGSLEVVGNRGRDIELEDITGEVTINGSFSGDLHLRNIARAVRLQSPSTDLRVENVPGHIHMDLGDFSAVNLEGPIRLSTNRSRDVQFEQFTGALELTVDRGDITLRPMTMPVPRIEARTRTGDITLSLPEAARFDLRATTDRGEVTNDFGTALRTDLMREDRPRRRAGGEITGSTGEGPPIVLHTNRGSVTIRKDTGGPPAPPRPARARRPPRESVEISAGQDGITIQKH